jgi:uncharacterized protein
MISYLPFKLQDHRLLLSSSRTIFWEDEKILILSDLHLGKSGHFRKSGIAIPQTIFQEDMHCLVEQIQFFKPEQLVIVGDLFHSSDNKEHELFVKWRNDLSSLAITLVKGNHDILKDEWYSDAGLNICHEALTIRDFSFTHDIDSCSNELPGYCFSGHIHPGITISGMGRQSLRFPCFYFTKTYAVLPSFGKFTGSYPITPRKGEKVFAIVGDSIIPFHLSAAAQNEIS